MQLFYLKLTASVSCWWCTELIFNPIPPQTPVLTLWNLIDQSDLMQKVPSAFQHCHTHRIHHQLQVSVPSTDATWQRSRDQRGQWRRKLGREKENVTKQEARQEETKLMCKPSVTQLRDVQHWCLLLWTVRSMISWLAVWWYLSLLQFRAQHRVMQQKPVITTRGHRGCCCHCLATVTECCFNTTSDKPEVFLSADTQNRSGHSGVWTSTF